jgi:lysophospholipid acyltransferase (LPLAT)-like uncharacterized protein
MRISKKGSPTIVSWVIASLVRLVTSTLRIHVRGEERIPQLIEENGTGIVLVTWHGRTLVPISRFRNRGWWSMISTSRDGEYQNAIFKRFGFNTVRGSTSARGAVVATLQLVKHARSGGVLAMTPDGPRGPSGCAQPGIIFLASRAGCPILPTGISAYPRTLVNTWDRYLIPWPFARAVILFGDPIYIPEDAKSEEAQQFWAQKVGCEIDALEKEAEAIARGQATSNAPKKIKLWRRA